MIWDWQPDFLPGSSRLGAVAAEDARAEKRLPELA
jgi:hypothetical protein